MYDGESRAESTTARTVSLSAWAPGTWVLYPKMRRKGDEAFFKRTERWQRIRHEDSKAVMKVGEDIRFVAQMK